MVVVVKGQLLNSAKAIRSSYLVDLLTLALNTGMRREEMLGLEWHRVDFQTGLIHLEAHHTKSGKRRSIPLNNAARGALLSQARHREDHCPDARWVFLSTQWRQDSSDLPPTRRTNG